MNTQKSFDSRTFSYTQKQPYVNYSRSKEIFYDDIGKTRDKINYDSKACNVFRYQCSPNRDATPIKPPKRVQTTGFMSRRKSKQELMVLSMAKTFSNIDEKKKQEIIDMAKCTNLRYSESLPRFTGYKSRRLPFVINDYHIRETNPGYARNDLGNIFTH
jgi:hypothetical protein